ncbi:CMGC SRPK kinase [Pyrenophora seminiperda CCB06]|uniref:non-specific serine/threonine protein kinase n=1 Tax=Pyrenophora seminiperda CCB06 TaxID=1302712 RepID=A0A3M7MAP3_9PLEO|nr:CMGC SRPK kinase [Pyrenophora seminiperda CCB06]
MYLRRTRALKCALKPFNPSVQPRSVSHTFATRPRKDPLAYNCGINAEPWYRYEVGGYHPIALGDVFKDGRYKVLHKLGWGGYSTVWAAKDQRKQQYVALKVSVAEIYGKRRELQVLRTLAGLNSKDNGSRHVMQFFDHFHVEGPNGKHECLVLEFLGPSVTDVIDSWFPCKYVRLLGSLAKTSIQHALVGLAYLHKHNIAHGGTPPDLHTRQLTFSIPSLHTLTEAELFQKLGSPETGAVTRKDGKPLEANMPAYLVGPICYPIAESLSQPHIKIADFGESFLNNDVPKTLHTPVVLRPPEVIFRDKLDYRVDLWSTGCMIFELITGRPPFDSFGATRVSVVREMLENASDDLPERWQKKWQTMDRAWTGEKRDNVLQKWLKETYYYDGRKAEFTREDLVSVGAIVRRLLHFEPSTRASAKDILEDGWFVK